MQLNVLERVVALEILPSQGTYADLVEIRKARETLALREDDLKQIQYDAKTEKFDPILASKHGIDIPVSEWAANTLRSILLQKEKDKKLSDKELTLYEKFVLPFKED